MKDTMVTWVPSLLYDVFSVPTSFSVLITLLLPLLSVCGTALSLGIRKVISNHNVSQAVLFLGAAAAFTGVYISCRMHFMLGVILFAGMNACLMAAINNIITSVIPLERGSGAGLFAGIMDACCYVGSTLSGFLPGLIIERGGFDPLLSSLPVCALALAVFTLAVTFFRIKRKKD